jgi:hypothetical protein
MPLGVDLGPDVTEGGGDPLHVGLDQHTILAAAELKYGRLQND